MEDGWVRDPSHCPGEGAEKRSGHPAGRELELSRGERKVAHGEMQAEIGDRLNQTGGSEPWLHSLRGGVNHTPCTSAPEAHISLVWGGVQASGFFPNNIFDLRKYTHKIIISICNQDNDVSEIVYVLILLFFFNDVFKIRCVCYTHSTRPNGLGQIQVPQPHGATVLNSKAVEAPGNAQADGSSKLAPLTWITIQRPFNDRKRNLGILPQGP